MCALQNIKDDKDKTYVNLIADSNIREVVDFKIRYSDGIRVFIPKKTRDDLVY